MASTIPYFDRRITYTTDVFKNSIIQTYIALFISKPDLYKDIYELHEYEKQSYFFYKFHRFLYQYYHFNIEKEFDMITYFGELQINKKGSVSVCGGGDASRNAKKNALKSFNKAIENTIKSIEYFNQKYKIIITSVCDEREFIGHREIWKNPSPKLLEKDGWEWVANQCYDDLTLTKPIPDILDKYLIPLEIRNKTFQKWKNQKSNKNKFILCGLSDTESETDIDENKNEENINIKETLPKLEISDDLQREIDDLF